jgi:protein involved in polysaccharide export with SLBB domain
MKLPKISHRAVRRAPVVTLMVCLAAFVSLSAARTASAQAPPSSTAEAFPADLSQQNLNRVAASAMQIEQVLRKDAGLLVELKRWVAKEATDRGQIVEDSDLTDTAIFDRLRRDLEFRAVATRLLQRYGYLIPQINPDSETAKQNELVRQERARMLARAAEREMDEALRTDRARVEDAKAPREDRSSTREPLPPTGAPADRTRERGSQTAPPAKESGEKVLRAETDAQQRNPLEDPELRSRLVQAGLVPANAAATRAGDTSTAAAFGAKTQTGVPPSHLEETPELLSARAMEAEASPFRRAKTTTGRDATATARETSLGPEILSRANPYVDIPALYDLYRQVSPRAPKLARFGEDVFRGGFRDPEMLPMDLPVGPDYVVGPGDSLTVDLWGAVSMRLQRTVDAEGRISLPEVGPVLVSGRSLGQVQQGVQQVLRTQYRDVSADVSLSRLRTIRVWVVGDVTEPGAYDISSLSTPLNALFVAGGPTAAGSLRVVKHLRGQQLLQEVDLYDLMLRGVRSDLRRLENGDTVLVPPVSAQVTVEGAVRRPAVYELRGEKNLAEVLQLAGGILPTATLRQIQVQRIEAHEKRTMISIDIDEKQSPEAARKQLESFELKDGDAVRIFPIAPYNVDAVYLQGHVLRPGRYSFREGMKLTDLVASFADLLPEPSMKYAEIVRLNPPDYRPSVESVDLGAALNNTAAAPVLKPLDTVRIFSKYDFEYAPVVWVGGEVRQPGLYRTSGQVHLRDVVHLAGGITPDAFTENAQVFRTLADSKLRILSVNLAEALAGNPIDNILLQPRDRVVVHRNVARVDPPSVYVKGEVAKPGRYPLTTNMRVGDLIRLAGGLKRSAYVETADLTRFLAEDGQKQLSEQKEIHIGQALTGDPANDVPLRDGDTLAIRQIPGWNDIGAAVVVRGEVQHAGTYGVRPGEKLSSVLKRAGGFLDSAYPQAALLERIEVREFQEKSRQELIQRVEQDAGNVRVALDASPQEQAALQQAALQQRERVLSALRQAPISGRLVIRLYRDLSKLEGSADDIELRNGDRLFVPKRPDFVLVTGQVYNSNAITFTPRKSAGWYLRRAGGATGLADKKAIFIVRASGEVISASDGGWWGGGVLSQRIEPGDTIVVPERPVGTSTVWKNLLSVAQVAAQTGVAAAVVLR